MVGESAVNTGRVFRCLFCGLGGKRTKEHVLRRSFKTSFSPDLVHTEMTNQVWLGDGTHKTRQHENSQFDATVNEVCESCNNGWLEDLENEVEGPLLQMAEVATDTPAPMPGAWVGKVADLQLWMTTRALMRTAMEARSHRAPEAIFRAAYETRKPPRGTIIHAAVATHYVQHGGLYQWGYAPEAGAPRDLSQAPPSSYVGSVSFGFGFLFFQVLLNGGSPVARRAASDARRWSASVNPAALRLFFPFDDSPRLRVRLGREEAYSAAEVMTHGHNSHGAVT
jgi:hypothetical protein